jgi:uncharacterized membrane protein YjgN (DUF898 family)
MEKRITFTGSGSALLVEYLKGMIFTIITLGFYTPWFMVRLTRWICENLFYGPTNRGAVRFGFVGTGGQVLLKTLVGSLLTVITLGIYMPWFLVNLGDYLTRNTFGQTEDGTYYRLHLRLTGGSLLLEYLKGVLLTFITLGIYFPWFICRLRRLFDENLLLLENEQPVGKLAFSGSGGELFKVLIVGYLLTIVTLGIYAAWWWVEQRKFYAQHTQVNTSGQQFSFAFTGSGGELILKFLLGYFLTLVSLGIYGAWFLCDFLKWVFGGYVIYQPQMAGAYGVAEGAVGQGYPPQQQPQGYPPQQQPQGGHLEPGENNQ